MVILRCIKYTNSILEQNLILARQNGRYIFPDDDPREKMTMPEVDYHDDRINNDHGFANFIGLISYYLNRKLLK